MTLKLYDCYDRDNDLDKTLLNETEKNITFLDKNDVINPIIILNEKTNKNYCYIEELNRYYFIKNVTILNNNLFKYLLKLDVLQTYKNIIKNLSLHCIETDDITDCVQVDYIESDETYIENTNIEDVLDDESFVLITIVG